MIISHRFQTVFIHIPKCAGTSIRETLVQADPDCQRMWGWRWMARHQRYGDSAHVPLIDLQPQVMNAVRDYTVIALTRDPMTRFISAIHQHFMQHEYRRKLPVPEFLRELDSTNIRYDPAYVHFCPQHYFIYISTKRFVDHVLRIEDPDWPAQMKAILVRQGFPESRLDFPVRNKSEDENQPQLSGVDLDWFYRLYKRDYELLGYDAPIAREYVIDTSEIKDAIRPLDFSSYDEVNIMSAKFRKFWPNP
ncbi:sulfotransferase family 2 domain-containing protein [Albidovulum sp.]|uniref:sulfotransferase family 2 domain-containing protein n=1 Tax=Albidovulum sp. TaxID=1872424 RepID=UPI0039B8B6FE